jgi:uncharacterized membrane protein
LAGFWKGLVWAISGVSLVAYPLLVWFGWTRLSPRLLGGALLLALGIRFLAFGSKGRSLAPAALIPLVPVAAGAILGEAKLFLWYPAFISGATGIWFGTSLRGRPAIEGFARLRHPDLPPHAVRHCRQATVAWTIFLALNTTVAAGSALWGNLRFWTVWNGGISYALMGLMFAVEFAVRLRRKA